MLGLSNEFSAVPSYCLDEAQSRSMRRRTLYKPSENVFRTPVDEHNLFMNFK